MAIATHVRAVITAFALAAGCSDAPAAPRPQPMPTEDVAVGSSQVRGRSAWSPSASRVAHRASLDASSLDVLRDGLASADYATQLTATEALGYMPGPASLQLLEHQLGDAEEDVRAAAILALGRQTGPRAIVLLESVRDDEQERLALRVLAVRSLASPPPPCLERN